MQQKELNTCRMRVPMVTWPWRELVEFFSIKNFKTYNNHATQSLAQKTNKFEQACDFAHANVGVGIHVTQGFTTAVEDIERKAPTKIPSEGLPPHNCKQHQIRTAAFRIKTLQNTPTIPNTYLHQKEKLNISTECVA